MHTLKAALWLSALFLIAGMPLFAAGANMIGRQSQNEGMLAVPAPGKVTIDGDLKDWDWSGRIWVFADTAVRDRYSVEAAAMWDKDYLYLAAKWKDPMPLNSIIDPALNPDEGWKEDSWQMRVTTADQTLWITTWYFATKRQPVMHFAYWKNKDNLNPGTEIKLLIAQPGGTELGEGVQEAYRADTDGKGFVQEMRIPWKLLYKTVPEIKSDLTFRVGSEFLWGDPTGKTWPIHRYADNMQPGKTSREFFWTERDAWGDVKLVEKGNVPVREYIAEGARIEGTVPVRVSIPSDATRFTIAIEDENGKRIRNLAGDCDPKDYRVPGKAKAGMQTIEVKWDCLDDKGKLVQPGAYRVRGLTHKGLAADYVMNFYNPGNPPWATKDGRGAWGADHSGPIAVAAGDDWTVVTFPVPEGGSGIIGIDPTGQKRWGDRHGTSRVTADAQYAYAYVTSWYTPETICRFGLKNGTPMPFELDGKPRTFDLTLKEIFDQENPGKVTGMAVNGGKLVLALTNGLPAEAQGAITGKLAVLDANSAGMLKQLTIPGTPGEVTFSRDGRLYGVVDGKACQINLETGAFTPISTPGLGQAGAIAVDPDGNLLIADIAMDSQLKAYNPQGQLVYTCGKKGGRPICGVFDEQAMMHVSSVAVDGKGQAWVTENWNYPRRVSVWGRDGKLVRDFLGNTGYAGEGCYLHDQDPTLGYCGPIEFKLDQTSGAWKIKQILWVPDSNKGECFNIDTGENILPQRFTSKASGQPHEYMFAHNPNTWGGTGNVVYMERNGRWQPVAAICLVGHISGKFAYGGAVLEEPSGQWAGLNGYDGVIWNDLNKDGIVQRNECTIVNTSQPGTVRGAGKPGLELGNGWGGRMGSDMSIYTDGLLRYRPTGFTDDGAPIYSLDGRSPLGVKDFGDLTPAPGEDRLICLSWDGYAGPTKLTGINLKSNQVEWYYANPYPGVHGSHNATMPKPGLLIGPLKNMGFANMGDNIGNVFAMRGNLGQDFFMTTDGLFVGALFQDGRLPGDSLPDKVEMLKGMPMEGFSEGGEPFNGWFGRQNDGKVRLTTGMSREACTVLEIKGLETIRRFTGNQVKLGMATIVKADQDNITRKNIASEPKRYTITRLATPPTIDGLPNEWNGVPAITVAREGSPDRATVKLAYDDTNLYALYDVQDTTPWLNEGKDYARLFKTGDAVDLQLGVNPAARPHNDPQASDLRVVIGQLQGKPIAVLMAPVDPNAPKSLAKDYTTGWTKHFDRVEILAGAHVAVKVEGARYRVEAAIPLASLGLSPKAGMEIRGDVGFISSDAQGLIDTARTYWANPNTNLVNDMPLEAWIYPGTWGTFDF